MEEFENDYDKSIYWIFFVIIVVVLGVGGYFVTFHNKEEEKEIKEKQEENDSYNIKDYVGVWQLMGEDTNILSLQEFIVEDVSDSNIKFTYLIDEVAYFNNESGKFDLDSKKMTFDIYSDDGKTNLKGSVIFNYDKVYLTISYSSNDDIPTGMIEFRTKGDEKTLN